MAYFRQIHVSTWKDPWFFDLEPDEKLLFIYLFSNENTSISGIYEIPFRVICFETGLSSEFVKVALDKFEEASKVYFENGVIWVKNLRKYNASTSEKIKKGIENDLAKIPECPSTQRYIAYYSPNIPYTKDIDTLSLQDNTKQDKDNTKDSSYIFSLYEQEIGLLTPLIAEQIKDWVDNHPQNWIEEAIKISVESNKRNVRYINGILKNWRTDGRDSKKIPEEVFVELS